MKNKILALKKKLGKLEEWLASPHLYVAENSYSLRNEIDIEAEYLLNKSSQSSRGQILVSAEHAKINENRKLMIDHVNACEYELLKMVKKELDIEYAEEMALEIKKYTIVLQELETNVNEDILFDLESAIDISIYEFEMKINIGTSMLFLNVDQLNMCIPVYTVSYYKSSFFEENSFTTFGFLYVLDDYISKENFK